MNNVTIRVAGLVGAVDRTQWDGLAGTDNPFLSHTFLSLLEESGSVGPGTGWTAASLTAEDDAGTLIGAAPCYLKDHSQGEYVFDHGWAEAWHNAGGAYYPKLQLAVPFTPVTGRRLLARTPAAARHLIAGMEAVVEQHRLSSAHATFIHPDEVALFRDAGWLMREDSQFHWRNQGFAAFDDFLATLSSRKRKDIRKERATAQQGLDIVALTGDAIQPRHWDAFWAFYQDTGSRKWGQPYLTRDAFTLLGENMADRLLLVMACRDGEPIAGALNFIGAECLYGRYWGCVEDVPCLHFELCYYQAIDFAIARGLARVEAGAQGAHKLARGYEPVPTWSAHHIPHAGFREAVARFLMQERAAVAAERQWLSDRVPYRKGD